jgi:hypothetical protein
VYPQILTKEKTNWVSSNDVGTRLQSKQPVFAFKAGEAQRGAMEIIISNKGGALEGNVLDAPKAA